MRRGNDFLFVIASVSEAIQGGLRGSWIASSLSLLAMTRAGEGNATKAERAGFGGFRGCHGREASRRRTPI